MNQGRKGMQKKGRSSRETIALHWGQGPGSPSSYIQSNIFELFCRPKTPNKWKMLKTVESLFITEKVRVHPSPPDTKRYLD